MRESTWWRRLAMLGFIASAVACSTSPGGPTQVLEPAAPPASAERVKNVAEIATSCRTATTPSVTFTPIRRLNRIEYQNSVRDLLGVDVSVASFVSDARVGTFSSNVDVAISELQADQYRLAADSAAARAVANLGGVVACEPAGGMACASAFVRDFGLRAFRRPLTSEEQANYLRMYQVGAQTGSFAGGVALVIRAMLQSPYFLYIVEPTPAAGTSPKLLGPYEIASRLSFLLWASGPDAALFAAAAAGELATADQLRAQAARLLAEPRAKATMARFQLEWLQLDGIDVLQKDGGLFPEFDADLKRAMKAEVADFFDSVLQRPTGTYAELLTAPYALPSGRLLQTYGAAVSLAPGAATRLDFVNGERSGILTQPLFLSVHAHQNQGSPVKRGVVIRQAMLCQDLPPPPVNVNNSPPPPSPDMTTRERFARHSQDPACRGCHSMIDGIGFGFERYDAIGAYRPTENGVAIDQSGNLIAATADVEGPFDGPTQLGQKLANSELAQSCFVTQWFRFAYKREPRAVDACTAKSLLDRFAASGNNLKDLVLSAVTTQAFRYGMAEPKEADL